MKAHFLPDETLERLSPEDMGLVYCSAQRLEIKEPICLKSGSEELCLVCLDGSVEYTYGGKSGTAVMCDMLYLPRNSALELKGGPATVMRFGAPSSNA